jgi:hypothetical protein
MESTSKVFEEAVASNWVPQRIMSDNGTEFIGRDFQAVALEYSLMHHGIHSRAVGRKEELKAGGEHLKSRDSLGIRDSISRKNIMKHGRMQR